MAGWATLADYRDKVFTLNQRFTYDFVKAFSASEVSGSLHSAWKVGSAPAAGSDPATTPGTVYTNATGSINFPDKSPSKKFLVSIRAQVGQAMQLLLYDRLVAVSGISLASTGDKTINTSALTRYTGTDADYNEIWLELTTATTVTAVVVSANSYTNSAGTTGRAGPTTTFAAAAQNVDSIIPLSLQAGDYGARSVETINVATAASAGVCNVLIVRKLAELWLPAAKENSEDYALQLPPYVRIFDGASIGIAMISGAAIAPIVFGSLEVGWN